ncbi:MAG: hypothetical protein WCC69_11805 [Pirellulales bacterium]
MLRGLRGDCYAGFPGVPDPASQDCWSNAPTGFNGLSGIKLPADGRKFLKCLSAAMGLTERESWTPEFHADVFAKIGNATWTPVGPGGGGESIAFPEEWGKNPGAAAKIVSNYAHRMLADGDSFWTCIGIPKTDAMAQIQAQEGAYWDLIHLIGRYINAMESGATSYAALPRPSMVGGLVVGLVGVSGLMWMARKGRR